MGLPAGPGQDVPAAFMRAYAAAIQPPAGPVFLSLPLDDWAAPADGLAVVRSASIRTGPDPARLRLLADAIAGAKRPVLIFGAAVARASGWDQAVALAEKMDAPVWAAPASERTPFPEDHPLYQGGLPFAIGPLAKHLDGYDLAVVVGAPVFRYYPYIPGDYLPGGLRLWHVTDDPAEAARAAAGTASRRPGPDHRAAAAAGTPRHPHQPLKPPLPHRMSPLPQTSAAGKTSGLSTAGEVFDELRRICPADAILVEETPSNRRSPRGLADHAAGRVLHHGQRRAGLERPGQRGHRPGRARQRQEPAGRHGGRRRVLPVLAAIDLDRSQLRLPILFIVLRNGEYAILKAFAEVEDSPGVPGLDIPGIDIVCFARGYGCHAARADSLDVLRSEAAAAATGTRRRYWRFRSPRRSPRCCDTAPGARSMERTRSVKASQQVGRNDDDKETSRPSPGSR